MKKYFLLITLLILFPYTIHAECSNEDIDYYKANKDKFKVTYEFNRDTKKYKLILDRINPENYDYIVYIGTDKKCEDITDEKSECYDINPGEYIIKIVGQSDTCNEAVDTFTIKLPQYNKYYEDPLCEDIKEFYLCDPSYEKEIDYDTFVERIETYKRTKKREETEQETENKDNSEIINYIKENMLSIIIIPTFVITVIITIVLMAKSIKKSRRLE